MTNYAPCPQCGQAAAEKMKFTWWGGILGPRILTHVKCQACGKQYNGKTGKENTAGIAIYMVVVGIACVALILVMFVALGMLLYASR